MKKEKHYLKILSEKFQLESQDGFHCFGCGWDIEKKEPEFLVETDEGAVSLCLSCAILAKKKERQEIRKEEFDIFTMANAHKKNHLEFARELTKRDLSEVLLDIFPEFPKVTLIGEESKKE